MNENENQNQNQTQTYSKDELTWGMLSHLSAFCGFIIPFGNIIAPLIIWLIKKDQMPFVDYSAKEAINFQISLAIYFAVAFVLVFLLIGIPLLIALAIFEIVMIIMASVKANQGDQFKYPMTIRFIK